MRAPLVLSCSFISLSCVFALLTALTLSSSISSPQGCSLLSDHNVTQPLWDTVIQVVKGEELTQGRPLLQEEKEDAMAKALVPLLTLLSTFQGNGHTFIGPFPHPSFLHSLMVNGSCHSISLSLLPCVFTLVYI